MRVVCIFSLTKLETTEMKAGGTRPTARKTFLFSTERLCTQQANIIACGHRRRRTHSQLATLG
jgi:hypothetical protein